MYVCRSLRLGWVKLYAIGWATLVSIIGRCEKFKFGEMYCTQMKLGACHKNKIGLEKKFFQKCTDVCDHAFEKISSPHKSQKKLEKNDDV